MSDSHQNSQNPYDQKLAEASGLTWLPWVGENYENLSSNRRVLIVGESHYSSKKTEEEVKKEIDEYMNDPNSTRDMVEETLINWEWYTSTLSNIHYLCYAPENTQQFWADLCYYNFIQRPMRYYPEPAERPNWQDFTTGWEVFLKVVEILEPSQVLMIGVESANHFDGFMQQHNRKHGGVIKTEKVGRAYARSATVKVGQKTIPLHFIRHCGQYFSSDKWSEYLCREAPELMKSIASSAKQSSH